MASIKKRGNNYQITVSLGRDQKGKQIIKTTTFKPTSSAPSKAEKEVQAFAVEFENKIKEGKYIEGDRLTFCDVIQYWKCDQTYKDLTIRAREDYEYNLERRAVPVIGNLVIGKVSPVHLQAIYNEMEEDGMSSATMKKLHTAINSVMDYAFRMELIKNNPCDRVRLPKIQKDEEIRYFEYDEAKRFMEALPRTYMVVRKGHTRVLRKTGEKYTVPDYEYPITLPYQFQVFYMIALNSGFRRGEMIALTWKDIDFEKYEIDINKAASKTRSGGIIIKKPKTKASIRRITLPPECFDMLREWKNQQRELSLSVGSKWTGYRGKEFDKNYIFIRTDDSIGSIMYIDTPSKKFVDFLKLYNSSVSAPEEKLPIIRLHDLRHTHATMLIGRNVNIETIAERLGHANPSVTLDIYGHALKSMDKVAADVLRNILFCS